jgi:hypothetical protein
MKRPADFPLRDDRDKLTEFLEIHRPEVKAPGAWSRRDRRYIMRAAHRLYARGYGKVDFADCFQQAALEHHAARSGSVSSHPMPDRDGWTGVRRLIVDTDSPAHSAAAAIDKQKTLLTAGGRATRLLLRYNRLIRQMSVQEGREPSHDEAAKHLGISVKSLEQLLRIEAPMVSLDERVTLADTEERVNRHETVSDPTAEQSIDVVAERQQRDRLRSLLEILTPIEKAAALGAPRRVSKQASQQARKRAIEKMQAEAKARGWLTDPEPRTRAREWGTAYKIRSVRVPHLRDMAPPTLDDLTAMAAGRDWGARPAAAVPLVVRMDLEHWGRQPGTWPAPKLENGPLKPDSRRRVRESWYSWHWPERYGPVPSEWPARVHAANISGDVMIWTAKGNGWTQVSNDRPVTAGDLRLQYRARKDKHQLAGGGVNPWFPPSGRRKWEPGELPQETLGPWPLIFTRYRGRPA